jgi:formylglycine-generating enzyme required for sulfatase activity
VVGTNWYEAAAYCNWLSSREGIAEDQWCYETNPQGQVTGVKPNYLNLTGYRLPTESEWEYACRAGALTSRYYGESDELLGKYAWFLRNAEDHSWPVGSKKPNDLGLFDMHGNVWSWCQDRYDKDYPKPKTNEAFEDREDVVSDVSTSNRVSRGVSFMHRASFVRSATRNWDPPTSRYSSIGFRPARTFR